MKKLTSLQILLLMSLSLGSSYSFSKHAVSARNQNEAAKLELQSVQDEAATIDVLQDLDAQSIEQLVESLSNLDAKLSSIKHFVDQKNREINDLLKEKSVAEEAIAIKSIEIANAQAMFEKTLAQQKTKHKHAKQSKYEQEIRNALKTAEKGVKLLAEKSMNFVQQAKKSVNKLYKSKTHKAQAQAAREIPGVEDEVASRLAEKHNISEEDAHAIIDNTLSDDEAEQKLRNEAVQRIAKFNKISVEEARAVLDKFMMADDSEQTSDDVVTQAMSGGGQKKQQAQGKQQQAQAKKQQAQGKQQQAQAQKQQAQGKKQQAQGKKQQSQSGSSQQQSGQQPQQPPQSGQQQSGGQQPPQQSGQPQSGSSSQQQSGQQPPQQSGQPQSGSSSQQQSGQQPPQSGQQPS